MAIFDQCVLFNYIRRLNYFYDPNIDHRLCRMANIDIQTNTANEVYFVITYSYYLKYVLCARTPQKPTIGHSPWNCARKTVAKLIFLKYRTLLTITAQCLDGQFSPNIAEREEMNEMKCINNLFYMTP